MGLCLVLATALSNLGIIALDDYDFVISQIIPAQKIDFQKIQASFDIRSPVHPIVLGSLSRAALAFGVSDPSNQLRFVLFCLALIGFTLHAFGGLLHFEGSKERKIFLSLLGFYFLSPLFLSRPMIESTAAPFITLSSGLACRYLKSKRKADLIGSILFLTLASLFRFQAGVCLAGWFYILWKTKRAAIPFVLTCLGCFVGSGLVDRLFGRPFHSSLYHYLSYNLQFAGDHYGRQPIYVFPLLFLGMTLPPSLLPPFKKLAWKKLYAPLLPAVFYFGSFVLAHTLSAHKEERFMIPVLALFFVVLTPLLSELAFPETKKLTWRGYVFLALNFILLIPATLNAPQSNTIGVVRYLNSATQFQKLTGVEDTLVIYPTAFATREVPYVSLTAAKFRERTDFDCDELVVLRSDIRASLGDLPTLTKIAEFSPGILEEILVLANPLRNQRRTKVEAYASTKCLR